MMKGIIAGGLVVSFVGGIVLYAGAQYEIKQEQSGDSSTPPACTPAKGMVSAKGSVTLASSSGLSKAQVGHIKLAVSIGVERGLPGKDLLTSVTTMLQESAAKNLSWGHLDSVGLFQQRAGWGTAKQRLDPVYAINKFYSVLEKVKGRSKMPPIEVALKVQRPSEWHYRKNPTNNFPTWEKRARSILGSNIINRPAGKAGAAMLYEDCSKPGSDPKISTKGWIKPLSYIRVGSPWGMRYHPILHYSRLHNGIDLSSPKGAKIYAVGPGTIITMARGYNGGAGNYVAIDHGDGNVTKSLHMSALASSLRVGDKVKAGTVIGLVGSTGLSTAPHLHFAWYYKGKGVDPVPRLCDRGVNVPGPKGCNAAKYKN